MRKDEALRKRLKRQLTRALCAKGMVGARARREAANLLEGPVPQPIKLINRTKVSRRLAKLLAVIAARK